MKFAPFTSQCAISSFLLLLSPSISCYIPSSYSCVFCRCAPTEVT